MTPTQDITERDELLPCPFCGGPAVNVAFEYITCGLAEPMDESCIGKSIRAPVDESNCGTSTVWNTRAACQGRSADRSAHMTKESEMLVKSEFDAALEMYGSQPYTKHAINAAWMVAARPSPDAGLVEREALERIALLDEADGHELSRKHAFEAVAIATQALGKSSSQIYAERPADALLSHRGANVAEEAIAECIQQFWQGASGRAWDDGSDDCCVKKLPAQADWFRRLADRILALLSHRGANVAEEAVAVLVEYDCKCPPDAVHGGGGSAIFYGHKFDDHEDYANRQKTRDDVEKVTVTHLYATPAPAGRDPAKGTTIYFLFKDEGGPQNLRFVEAENEHGFSIKVGEWTERLDGLVALKVQVSKP